MFLSLHLKDLRQLSSQIFRGSHSRRGNSKCASRGVFGILKEQGGQGGRGVTWEGNRRGEVMGTGQMVEGMAGILGSLGSTLNERGSHWMGFEQRSNTVTEQVEKGGSRTQVGRIWQKSSEW